MAFLETDPIIIQKYTLPMLVPSHDESNHEWKVRWKKFDTLSEEVKDRLADEKSMNVIWRLSERAQFNLSQAAFLARAVRLYYFEELALEDFAAYFMKNIGVDAQVARTLADTLIRQVIKKAHKSDTDSKERMSLREALDRFRDLRGQRITQTGLTMAGVQREMTGTIERWITDYHLAIGQGRHSAVERGNYLFHNRNTKRLSAAERQRVAIILKSFDEDLDLSIDVERGVVLFPIAQEIPHRAVVQKSKDDQKRAIPQDDGIMKRQVKKVLSTQTMKEGDPSGYVQFSSGHRMQTEKQ